MTVITRTTTVSATNTATIHAATVATEDTMDTADTSILSTAMASNPSSTDRIAADQEATPVDQYAPEHFVIVALDRCLWTDAYVNV